VLVSDLVDLKKLLGGGASQEDELEAEELEEVEPNLLEEDVISNAGVEVGELVNRISSAKSLKLEEAARGLYRAVEDGKVRLAEPSPPESLTRYFASSYSLWFWGVCVFVGVVAFSIYLLPQVYPWVYIRYVVGAIFVLYVPGYTLIEALYSKRDELDRLERFALGVGLSLAVVPLVGLVLNYTPWGIRLDPVFASLILLTLALGVVGVYRKFGYYQMSRMAERN
jgi:hypothetical protein